MSAGLGNVNLTLGLNTSPATQALQQYYAKLNQGADQAAKAQKKPASALQKLTDKAKKLGFTYDKAAKTFKNGFGQTKNIEQMTKKVKDLDDAMERLQAASDAASTAIKGGFGNAMQGVFQGLGMAVGQQLLGIFTSLPSKAMGAASGAVQAFAEIDRSLRQTLSIAGESADRFDELAGFMNDLAAQTKFTANELAQASVQLARAGFSADEMKEALPGIAQGAAAAGESIETMSNVVIAALGGFQMDASETGAAVDILTAAANNSNTSVAELGEGLKYVGPIANSLGMSFADVSAAAGLLANSGIKASQMGTALRGGLTRLASAAAGTNSQFAEFSRGTGRMAGVLQQLGADIKTAEGGLLPMPQLLSKLKTGFDQLDTTDKALAAKVLFGDEAGSGWISLLNKSEKELESFFTKTNNASGVAAETSQQNLAGISGSLDLLNSAIGSVQAAFGKFINIGLKPVIDGITAVLNIFKSMPPTLQNLVLGMTALAGAVGAGVVAFGLLKALGVGAFLQTAAAGAAVATAAMVKLAGVMAGKVAAAFGVAIAKSTALGVSMKATTFTAAGLATKLKVALGAALKLATTGLVGAGKGLLAFGASAVKAFTAGTAAAAKFLIAIAPLALAAGAVAAVVGVFVTWATVNKQANDISKESAAITSEMTAGIEELIEVQRTLNQEWETSVQRVGLFEAGLDRLRRLLGGTTTEEVQLSKGTTELADSFDQFQGQAEKTGDSLAGLRDELASLTPGTEEYNATLEKYNKTEGLLRKGIEKQITALQKRRKALEGNTSANKETAEQERLQKERIDVNIRALKVMQEELFALKPASVAAAQGMGETADAADNVTDTVKKASDALAGLKKEFSAVQSAMKQSFDNESKVLEAEFEADTKPVKKELDGLKELESEKQKAFDKETARRQEINDQINRKTEKEIEAINQSENATIQAAQKEIDKLREASNVALDGIQKKNEAAQAAHANEMQNIDAQIAALQTKTDEAQAAYAAQIDALRELTPAEQKLAAIEKQRLQEQAKAGGEEGLRAQAQLERMERQKQIAEIEKKAAAEAEENEKKRIALEEQKAQKEEANAQRKIAAAQELEAIKTETSAAEKAREEELEAFRASSEEAQKARAEALAEQKEAQAEAEKAREAKRTEEKEANEKKISELENTLEEKRTEYQAARKAREEEYQALRLKNENDYRTALGENADFIVKSGDKAWKEYARLAIIQIDKVKRAQDKLAAANASSSALQKNFAGGPIGAGELTHINELGQEAFLGASGKLSMINKSANAVWRAPESGTIIPAHIAAGLGIPDRGMNINSAPSGSSPAARNAASATSGGPAQLMRALGSLKSGDRITNNVTIESSSPVQDASDMMVEMTKIKRRRLG